MAERGVGGEGEKERMQKFTSDSGGPLRRFVKLRSEHVVTVASEISGSMILGRDSRDKSSRGTAKINIRNDCHPSLCLERSLTVEYRLSSLKSEQKAHSVLILVTELTAPQN
jgi:hypothetical protein